MMAPVKKNESVTLAYIVRTNWPILMLIGGALIAYGEARYTMQATSDNVKEALELRTTVERNKTMLEIHRHPNVSEDVRQLQLNKAKRDNQIETILRTVEKIERKLEGVTR